MENLSSKSLMIGDWVVYDGDVEYTNPIKIEGMDIATDMLITSDREDVGFNGVEPIPLPDDFLDKNGFNKGVYTASQCFIKETDHVCYSLLLENGNQVVTLDYYDGKIELEIHTQQGCLTINNVRYVHEVQQAMRIMGIKKELEL